jgi:hypothetical protein
MYIYICIQYPNAVYFHSVESLPEGLIWWESAKKLSEYFHQKTPNTKHIRVHMPEECD